VTSSCVQEIDLTTGAIMGEIPFDLILTGNEKTRDIENVIPVGYHFVVAIYQQR
jgi:hypothetical protein